jgi:hypothetical protein
MEYNSRAAGFPNLIVGNMTTRTVHGIVRGKMIEIDEDLGVAEGQEVEVQVRVIPPPDSTPAAMSRGLENVYAILGERYESGHANTAERHNEHQRRR